MDFRYLCSFTGCSLFDKVLDFINDLLRMKDIEILIEGYARILDDARIIASPTTVLIHSAGKKILVDPGANAELLFESLAARHLNPGDIDIIFLTHYHPDHFLNVRFFPTQDICDGSLVYHKDEEIPYSSILPGTDIKVVATPGHTAEHSSLVVDARPGTYAIAGDVFWWEEGHPQEVDNSTLIELVDRFAQDLSVLKESRRRLLSMADFIIPGHGKIFKVFTDEVKHGI